MRLTEVGSRKGIKKKNVKIPISLGAKLTIKLKKKKMIDLQTIATYVAMHPRPSHVTQTQASEMLGLAVPTFRKLVISGKIKRNACGLFPITEVDKLLQPVSNT